MRYDLYSSIGNTPLIRLNNLAHLENINIFAKLEFTNPSGSIKDRIVKHIICSAESSGKLKPGATIVENTSGNTGAAIAMIAAAKGYPVILTMPDKVSKEKQDILRAYGAQIVVCPTGALPGTSNHYVQRALDIHKDITDSFMLNQYNNPLNSQAHYETTGPEIWRDTGGGSRLLCR